MMKLSISNIAWDETKNHQILNYLKEKEMDLEIAPTKIIKEDPYSHLDEAKKVCTELKSKYNVSISSMQSIWFGRTENIFESEENREKLLEYTKKAIDFSAYIGCPNLVFGSPRNRNMDSYEKDYPIAIEFFKKIGEYAKEKNVIIAIEPNPPLYHTNFLNTTISAIEFVKELHCENIKVNYDLGTVIENKENLDVLEQNIFYINHIHISEPNLVPIENRKIHQELLSILKKIHYDKYISIEMKQTDIEIVKRIIDYICELSRCVN